jgi:hypothetical protein
VIVGRPRAGGEPLGKTSMRTRLIQGALVLGATVVSLGFVELALRWWDLYRPVPNPVRPRSDLYEASPIFGYRLHPSRRTGYRYPPDSEEVIPLVSNSDGFRSSREFDQVDSRVRILVVGDSFVFGQGVRAEDRLTERLEALEPGWRVDNVGMTGWGVDLMIRALEYIGQKADPDVVVLAVYTDDFRRLRPTYAGVGYAYPKFDLVGDQLTTVPFPYPTAWERLRIVQAWHNEVTWRWDLNRYALNRALLNRFLHRARTRPFRPVVAFLPGREDTPVDQERREFLRRWSAAHDVPYLDLTAAIHGAGVQNVYIRDNWHWNAAGHQIAAEQLRLALLDVLPPGTARRD